MAPEYSRPPPLTHLTYAEKQNPNEVWREPVTEPQGTANSSVGAGCCKKRMPAAERHKETHRGLTLRVLRTSNHP